MADEKVIVSDERLKELLFSAENRTGIIQHETALALRELQQLRAENAWVKTSERLPELYKTVIVATGQFVGVSEWNGKTWQGREVSGVTH